MLTIGFLAIYVCTLISLLYQSITSFYFRWWRTYVPKDVSEDLSHSDTRLSVQLNGFELHVYNRSHLYQNLEKTFGLEPGILPEADEKESTTQDESGNQIDTSEYILGKNWRDLIPVIKVVDKVILSLLLLFLGIEYYCLGTAFIFL